MKIYTEVIYHWDDDKGELVQESSKFYDYDGPLTLANDSSSGIMDPTTSAQTSVQYMEYPSNIGGMSSQTDNWIMFEAVNFKSQNPTLNIAMYIPGGALGTSYKSEYETTSLGGIGAGVDRAVGAMQKQGAGLNYDTLAKAIADSTAGMASEGTGKVGLLKMGERANVLQEGTKQIMERATGAVLNPFLIAAYKGPSDMRTHDFDFMMLPQSVEESKVCVKIVSAFKKSMLPSHAGGDSQTAPSMMFGYPDTFTITYYINGKALPNNDTNPMFNIGKSVLTGCELNFDTENVPLFFDGTQYPVTISMKLSFMETDVMYREKVDQGF